MGGSKKSARVLVLNDDPDLVEALSNVLEAEGYEVHRRATRAVSDVVAVMPDVILIDCPPGAKTEVLKFVQQCRLRRELKDIPILLGVTSTKLLEPDVLRHRSIQVLVRPFSIDELLASVKQLMDASKSAQSS